MEQVTLAAPPQHSEIIAIRARSPPVLSMEAISTPAESVALEMVFIRSEVMKGIRHSSTTSNIMKIKVSTVGFLYSLTHFASFFSISCPFRYMRK